MGRKELIIEEIIKGQLDIHLRKRWVTVVVNCRALVWMHLPNGDHVLQTILGAP